MHEKDESVLKKYKFESSEIQMKDPLVIPCEDKGEEAFILDVCVAHS